MERKKTLAAIGVTGIVAIALASVAMNRGVDTSHYDPSHRAILPKQDGSGSFHEGYWPVSLEEAKRADAGVRDYLAAHRPELATKLDGYYAQIIGFEDYDPKNLGKKIVHLNFLCPRTIDGTDAALPGYRAEAAFHQSIFRTTLILVSDGGDCYFSIDFNPATGTYEHLLVNGDA